MLEIWPSSLSGKVQVPPSKSHTMRALLFALLSEGRSTLHHLLPSPDTEALLRIATQFGASWERKGETLWLTGHFSPKGTIDVGSSGIAYRFLTALSALGEEKVVIQGEENLLRLRPIEPLLQALTHLGVEVTRAPLTVRGKISSGEVHVVGRDSQFVSALLLALSYSQGPSHLLVEDPGEKPWVDLTLFWLKKRGISVEREGYQHFFLPGSAKTKSFTYTVSGDYSSAAFMAVAALLTEGNLSLYPLDPEDPQGDKKMISYLVERGAHCRHEGETLHIQKGGTFTGGEVDMDSMIDALPILTLFACFCEGKTTLYNAEIARTKECDRLRYISLELRKMGANISEYKDRLEIFPAVLYGADLYAHGDHRLAMTLTVAALAARGKSTLSGEECIVKSYPGFVNQIILLGAKILCR